MKNIQNLFSYKNGYTDFCHQAPFPAKWLCPTANGFLQFFQCKLKNMREVLLLKSKLI